jgi:demethylmenaquinone methyltransferase/2-methoxy-6-polyprenyl-1,4-benzoquinol methylase
MFDDIADSYDLLNDVLSFGLHRSWRRRAAAAVAVGRGRWILDLGCGTGGLGLLLDPRARVVGIDLSHAMLLRARRRSGRRLKLIGASALRLPFRDQTFGAVASAFVLRNLRDLRRAFEEVSRVLAPGGTIAFMDITEPRSPAFRWLFDRYLRTVAPMVGSLAGKGDAYRYLARSLGQLPPAPVVRSLLEEMGFIDCEARRLSGGAVTLFTARLPMA